MLRHFAILFLLAPLTVPAQTACPAVDFLEARTVNLTPSATSHIDVVRQSDGSYTGLEVANAAPYRTLAVTPHFERQFAACLPHTIPSAPSARAPVSNPPGASSQGLVSMPLANGNTFVAYIGTGLHYTFYIDIFDAQHNLLSETPFTSSDNDAFVSLALADLNLDGKLDLIAAFNTGNNAFYSDGGVWTFLGNGDGAFQPGARQVLMGGLGAAVVGAAVGDLNGDGKPDIVLVGSDQPGAGVFLGNGDGTFATSPTQFLSPNCNSPAAAIADLNGDGKADLVLGPCWIEGYPETAAVLLGNGDGTFQKEIYYPAVFNSVHSLAVGDLNGDGISDIATAGGTILFGDGKGAFPSRNDYVSPRGWSGLSVMIADFDGDGKPDIIFGTGNPTYLSGSVADPAMTVLFGDGTGKFIGAPVFGTTLVTDNSQAMASADFNGDGIADLVFANATSPDSEVLVTMFLGQGNGQFTAGTTEAFAVSDSVYGAVAADFNHDGKMDLAVLLYTGEVLIYLGNGDGTFRLPLTVTLPPATNGYYDMTTVDVNGDGIPDLVVTAFTGLDTSSVLVLLGNGDGTFSSPVSTISATLPAVAFGDFNGDGKLDMAVVNEGTASVRVYLGKGDGTFPSFVTTALPLPVGFDTNNGMVAADFNGDGHLDLALWLSPADALPQLAILSGKGDGSFSVSSISSLDAVSGASMLAADMNGNKIPDLVFYGGSNLSVALGNGDGTFQSPTTITTQANGAALTYLNPNGSTDLAVLGYRGIAIFQNLSQPPAALTVVSGASFALGPLAPDTFASAFGDRMGPAVTVTVQDSAGVTRAVPVLYASPNQINFLVPAATALGTATVTVNGTLSGKTLSAQVTIAALAPALFSVGSGIAAADVDHVSPDGTQTLSLAFTVQLGTITPTPINVTQPGQVFLELYGTGFDLASAGSTEVFVQGVSVPVTYSGRQGTYPGLDQINVLLPPSLAGTGVASVSVTAGGQTSNMVYVTIQ